MTTIINFVTTWFVDTNAFGSLTGGIALMSIILLLTLLVERVFLETYEGKPVEDKAQAFTIVIWPLLFVIAVVMFLRIAQVMPE